MKKILFITLVFGFCGWAKAQEKYSFQFDSTSLEQVIITIESSSDLKFYYQPSWIDSLRYTGNFIDAELPQVVQAVFESFDIYIYLDNNKVYLTKGTRIIDQPLISQRPDSENVNAGAKGLIFSQDYNEESNIDQDRIIEIGSRSKMSSSGNASLVGYVRDEKGEGIIGALVYTQEPVVAATTDINGFYSLQIPNGRHTIFIQHAGMEDTYRKVVLLSDGKLDIDLKQDVIALQELLVESERSANIRNIEMGVRKINVEDAKSVPIVLGERDVMKVATTVAGVQSLGEGAAGFNVRGGKSDQNLILFNGAPVYNASHFMGFFSVFNSDVIDDLEVFKSSIPARFGGRLSSVFDIAGKKADQEEFQASAGFSPVTSRISTEIPIIEGKAGLTLGGRTTYSNWILKQIKNATFRENRASFSDFVIQYDHQLDSTNSLTFSTYLSTDKLRLSSDSLLSFSDIRYRNTISSINWNRLISPNFVMDLNGYYSRYAYLLENDELELSAFKQDFSINDWGLNADFNYYGNGDKIYSFGIGSKSYLINPGSKTPVGENSQIIPVDLNKKRGRESFVYGGVEFDPKPNLKVSIAGRYVMYHAIGKQDVLLYDPLAPKNIGSVTDTLSFAQGKFIKTYHGPEYRMSLRYTLTANSSVKFSLNSNRQYLHTLSNSASLSPTDTWTLSDYHLKPQSAQQASLGFYTNLFGNQLEVSAESYYKRIRNLLDFKVGAEFLLNENVETVALQGPGKSYGFEFSLKKRAGKLNGWVNYTYSRSFIRLDGEYNEEIINRGEYYPTNYDKPHNINLIANYKLTKRISFSYNLNYSTGRPVTFPTAAYDFSGVEVLHYSDRNTFRIPDYLRMDIGINLDEGHRLKKFTHSYWSFSVYNLLGRDNPYSVFFDLRDGEVSGYKLVIFGSPVPTLSFNFRF